MSFLLKSLVLLVRFPMRILTVPLKVVGIIQAVILLSFLLTIFGLVTTVLYFLLK